MNKRTLLKIIGSMILSFIIATFMIKTIFISSGPEFHPETVLVFVSSVAESSSTQALIQSLQSTPFNNASPGIYTKENLLTSYLLIKENDVSWQNYSMNNNGRQIVIRIPKGEQLPQQNIISSITP